jgi:hypothetical protein
MSPRTAGFGNRGRFKLNGKIRFRRADRSCRKRSCFPPTNIDTGWGFRSLISEATLVGNFDLGKNYLTCGENSAERRFGITLFVRSPMSIGSKSILWSNLGRSTGLVRFGTTLAMYLESRDRAADVRTRQCVEPMEDTL